MAESAIEWTEFTWNCIRGCKKISPGCTHCYAETFAERFRGKPGHPYEQGFDFRIVPHKLCEPLRLTKSRVIFANSMSDMFYEDNPDDYIEATCEVMRLASNHIFQVLTKRHDRMLAFLTKHPEFASASNIWWGVSVENRKHGLPRIDALRKVEGAKTRFLSIEPLLEDLGLLDLSGIHWVIVGGESGFDHRPMDEAWVERIYEQCKAQNIHFFFKQWGGYTAKAKGRDLHGRHYDEMPNQITIPLSAQERAKHLKRMEAIAQTFMSHPLAFVPAA